ncbi:unnamed protein product, partial [Coccothraustes coccothraustes]
GWNEVSRESPSSPNPSGIPALCRMWRGGRAVPVALAARRDGQSLPCFGHPAL